jgi:hypothetical protein
MKQAQDLIQFLQCKFNQNTQKMELLIQNADSLILLILLDLKGPNKVLEKD